MENEVPLVWMLDFVINLKIAFFLAFWLLSLLTTMRPES